MCSVELSRRIEQLKKLPKSYNIKRIITVALKKNPNNFKYVCATTSDFDPTDSLT